MHLPGTNLRLPLWVVAAILLINGAIIGWGVRAGWAADAWSSYGTWVAGFATLAAVGVALWQTKKAQDHAEDARGDAQSLLATELDAQRRHAQVVAIVSVWSASTTYIDATKDLVKHYPSTIDNARDHETHEEARRLYRHWKGTSVAISNSYIEPNLLVSDRDTRMRLRDTQKACLKLRKTINSIQTDLDEEGVYNGELIGVVDSQIKEIYSCRLEMLKCARKNIAKVPALSEQEIEDLQSTTEGSPTPAPTSGHTSTHPAASPEGS